MATPDVRVRLSAEGVAEVVSALKTIQAEANKAAVTPTRNFGLLNGVMGNLKGMLSGIGVYFGARSIINWARGGLEAADAMGNLATRIGTTVERASALSWIAKKSDVDIQGLQGSFGRLSRQLAALEERTPATVKFFRDVLGMKPSDFKGKDIAESFALISQQLSKMAPGVARNNAVLKLFGKSGLTLIPMLNELGGTGLQGVIDKGQELGVILRDDAARAADALNDQLDTLQTQTQVMASEFITGVAPRLIGALSDIGKGASGAGSAFQQFGKDLATVVIPIFWILASGINGIVTLLDIAGTGIASLGIHILGLFIAGWKAIRGHSSEARAELARMNQEVKRLDDEWKDRMVARAELQDSLNKLMFGGAAAPGPGAAGGEGGDDDEEARARAAAEARLALDRASLDNEIALFKAKTALRNEADKQAWDQGLLSVQDYYARRREAAQASADAEIDALQRQRALLADESDDDKRAQDEQKIDAQIAKLREGLALDMLQLTGEERKAIEGLGDERLSIEARLLEAQGRRHEAAIAQLDAQLQKYDELLTKQGLSAEERAPLVQRHREILTAGADFEEAQREAQRAMDEVELARQDIQRQVDAGLITEIAGQRKIAQLEQGRLPNLQSLAAALLACAEATGDPERVAQARQFVASIMSLGTITGQVNELANAIESMGTDIKNAAIDSLADSLAGIGSESKNAKQAILSFLDGFARAVQQVMARLLALEIMGSFGKLFGGKAGGGEIEGRASGGMVRGPGTGASDSILAAGPRGLIRLSNGEFVVRARETQRPGGLRFLHAYNAGYFDPRQLMRTIGLQAFGRGGAIQRGMAMPLVITASSFAGGGAVGNQAPGAASGAMDGKLTIGLEEGLVLRSLESPEGERMIVRTIARNRRALSRFWR